MKKLTLLFVGQFLAVSMALTASAQTVANPMPITPPTINSGSGFIQFNNLTVESVSATNAPAEIVADTPTIYPLMGGTTSSGISNGANGGQCIQFKNQDDSNGSAIRCPMPPTLNVASGSANSAMPMIPSPTPIRDQSYRIEISASTELSLRDRTTATLSDFAAGDQINVFGYYNSDGSIQAYLVRDLSKPIQSEFLQLNNVNLVSISTSSPTQLVVGQSQVAPCYGFGTTGNASQGAIACPMGVGSSAGAAGAAVQNAAVPASIAPNWMMMRKYVINVNSQTIILDSNRTQLQLSDLQPGDQLNIYGDTTDNGQTLDADIIRDLSIPATAQSFSGTITQINSDGSFVMQTTNGQTITVPNPIQVGARVQLNGLLDRLSGALSQVLNVMISSSSSTAVPPTPIMNEPSVAPGMLRIKGGVPLPPNPNGTPNTEN